MMLIGMFDSPYVRRVAVSLKRLEIPFEHANWSVGEDFERIRAVSPLGRVPVLVLDDGESLTESAAILDALDDLVGPARALLPRTGTVRREALQTIALAIGAAEKARDQIYERIARPAEKYHEPWAARCRLQMHGALGLLEERCRTRAPDGWLLGERLTQADIAVACIFSFLKDAMNLAHASPQYPALAALTERCEELAEFCATRAPWFAARVES